MKNETFELPPKCKELKASQLLADWVQTLSPQDRELVLNHVQRFLEGDLAGVFILRNGIIEIRIKDPPTIFVYLYFDFVNSCFDFMKGTVAGH